MKPSLVMSKEDIAGALGAIGISAEEISQFRVLLGRMRGELDRIGNLRINLYDKIEQEGRVGYPPNDKEGISRRDRTHAVVTEIYDELTKPLRDALDSIEGD